MSRSNVNSINTNAVSTLLKFHSSGRIVLPRLAIWLILGNTSFHVAANNPAPVKKPNTPGIR